MKLLNQEEIDAHNFATYVGGFKGAMIGLGFSFAVFKLAPLKYPRFPKNLPWSIRTAAFIAPPTVLMTILAELSSQEFDRVTYGSGDRSKAAIEEHQRFMNMSVKDQIVEGALNNKYKIIVGAWAASMYASWKFVDRDPIMSKPQKIVQARMYAQALTVVLLLGTVALSVYGKKEEPMSDRAAQWQRLLDEEIAKEQEAYKHTGFANNEQRKEAKIYKYD